METQSPNQLLLEHIKRVPTNIEGVYGLELPPGDFDPLKADRASLIRYGFPLRPDKTKYPAAARLWQRVMSRGLVHITPQLRIRPEKKTIPPGKATDLTSRPWSGGILMAPSSTKTFDTINGGWTIPSVTPGSTGDGDWWSVAWVGIDGWNSPDVLQAGTGHHVSRKNGKVTTEYFAWYEWYPNNWTEISNLTVNPGDAMVVYVRYLGLSNGVPQGVATLTNMTAGTSSSITFSAPTGTTLAGNCAEWIYERPTFGKVLADLPQYGQISFRDSWACAGGELFDGSQAQAVDMTDTAGNELSAAQLVSSWECTFEAAS